MNKLPFKILLKIELTKFLRRKDWVTLIAICGTGLLFAASSLSDTYEGPLNQSGLYWVTTQIYNTIILFVVPFVMAFSATRILSSELEQGTLKLYIERIQDKKSIYLSKGIAYLLYSMIIFAASVVFLFAIYYIVASRGTVHLSGSLVGANNLNLIMVLGILYLASFVLPGLLAMCFGTRLKPTPTMATVLATILIIRNAFRIPALEWINPWTYVVKLVTPIVTTTETFAITWEYQVTLISFCILSSALITGMTLLGAFALTNRETA